MGFFNEPKESFHDTTNDARSVFHIETTGSLNKSTLAKKPQLLTSCFQAPEW
jgi:hypothetical protein